MSRIFIEVVGKEKGFNLYLYNNMIDDEEEY